MNATENNQEMQKVGLFRRAARAVVRTGVTLGIAAIAVVAVQMGSNELARQAESAPAPDPAPVMPVATQPVVLQDSYEITRTFVGQVEPQKTVSISFELSGQLSGILVDEGDQVTAGQVLATLDTRLLAAEKERLLASKSALEAQKRFALQTVERQSKLSDRGFASQAGLDEALSRADELTSRIAEVDASLVTNEIRFEKSTVLAPFTGTVTERRVDGGESLTPGQPLIEIVQQTAPQVRVGVPTDVTARDLEAVEIRIGDTDYDATLTSLRPDIDPVTRTRTAVFELATDDPLAFGQTARLVLKDEVAASGLWVPLTTLKEGLRGQWMLLGVDQDNVVRPVTVQVLHTHADKVFVRGIFPEGTQLIGAGPQRVTLGQTVDPQPQPAS